MRAASNPSRVADAGAAALLPAWPRAVGENAVVAPRLLVIAPDRACAERAAAVNVATRPDRPDMLVFATAVFRSPEIDEAALASDPASSAWSAMRCADDPEVVGTAACSAASSAFGNCTTWASIT